MTDARRDDLPAPDPAELASSRDRRAHILARVAAACGRAGRDPSDVQIVAVSKLVPADRLLAAVAAGFTVLGENRVQEAAPKIAAVRGARWHLVGHLQGNKAGRAIELFDAIETVDSIGLAHRLDVLAGGAAIGGAAGGAAAGRLAVYLQVNVDADPEKAGFDAEEVERALPELADLPRLELRGLMTVGRLVPTAEAARPTFAALRELGERLRAREPRLGAELSMGMSDDFEVAIEEGATLIRIGRAVFGERTQG